MTSALPVRARNADVALAHQRPHFERQFDHITYDVRLRPLSSEVVPAGRSDHVPVIATFILARR